VFLFAGRLSFHAKANPAALYHALQSIASKTGPIICIEAGVFPNAAIQRGFQAAQAALAPDVTFMWVDGNDAAKYRSAWQAADVFVSLSDNIQETFGLTPVEAMAAGLPVIVADWDGYKDTVRDGVDGFRIPTVIPQAGLGTDLAWRHAVEIDTYDKYCGHTSMMVAVDVQATAQAFTRLLESPDLRRRMGEAGRQRAREVYDWAAIIPRYEALWAGQDGLRRSQSAHLLPRLAHPWPARMDPFHAFAVYPTRHLTPKTMLTLAEPSVQAVQERVRVWRKLAMVDFARDVLPTEAETDALLAAAEAGPRPAAQCVDWASPERQAHLLRGLAWLVKLGVLAVVPEVPTGADS
jgi:hypothetical protein